MKTWKGVNFDTMFTLENAKIAVNRASEGKRNRRSVRRYLENEDLLKELVDDVINGRYMHSPAMHKVVYDHKSNKYRKITHPCFRDQIVHWMIMLQLSPYMMKVMINHTVAVIPKRGPILAHKTIKHWAEHHNGRDMRWVVQMDIRRYYESVDHSVLLKNLCRYIRDRRVLGLISMILDKGGQGLPLGFYISQWLANFYLNDIDHYIKEELKVKQYIRYVDDIIFFSKSKKEAARNIELIDRQFKKKKLEYKTCGSGAIRVARFGKNGLVDFCGVRTYGDGFQELRHKTYLRFRKSFKRVRKGSISVKMARGMTARYGYIKHTDSNIFKRECESIIKGCNVKHIISKHDRSIA